MDILILFKNSKKSKLFDKQLNENNINYAPFYNYTFRMKEG